MMAAAPREDTQPVVACVAEQPIGATRANKSVVAPATAHFVVAAAGSPPEAPVTREHVSGSAAEQRIVPLRAYQPGPGEPSLIRFAALVPLSILADEQVVEAASLCLFDIREDDASRPAIAAAGRRAVAKVHHYGALRPCVRQKVFFAAPAVDRIVADVAGPGGEHEHVLARAANERIVSVRP